MRLHRIRLRNALSFEDASLTCDHHVTALVGPNDAGKTNVLRILHRLTGDVPSLDLAKIRSQFFPKEEPTVDLSFVPKPNDRDALTSILGLPEPPPSPFTLTCRSKSLSLRLPNGDRELQAGEQVLRRLVHSVYVQSELRPMHASIPFSDIRNGVSSPEARLFRMAGLSESDLDNIFRRTRKGTKATQDAGDRLTTELGKHWRQETNNRILLSLKLSEDLETSTLDILVEDATEHVCVSLNQRGEGLRWFLALLAQLHETPLREQTRCNLFLIDEPGVFLHPQGQRDLYCLLSDLSEKDANQIIYATHSPFMLDWSRPHEIRVIERNEGPIPASSIVDKAYHDNNALLFWEPFRRSLGLDLPKFFGPRLA